MFIPRHLITHTYTHSQHLSAWHAGRQMQSTVTVSWLDQQRGRCSFIWLQSGNITGLGFPISLNNCLVCSFGLIETTILASVGSALRDTDFVFFPFQQQVFCWLNKVNVIFRWLWRSRFLFYHYVLYTVIVFETNILSEKCFKANFVLMACICTFLFAGQRTHLPVLQLTVNCAL